ncbi:hypothetical protein [Amycolatopsis sp. 195334CR]|uniref:hypothetical protein n=1 Tax=Amycolatopsis sp. 195334CR TaxID=2814588 RepID=UPI001A8D28AB|nr:hypothetical protein [Amycolatopsis sp. 195334CR]MBN6038099.1 hypothetical protein [Amycolatopsis sp. 195334CR]
MQAKQLFALLGGVLLTVLLGVLPAVAARSTCSVGAVEVACPRDPVGPDGRAVSDRFTFAHRPLGTEGEVVAHLASMSGVITYPPPEHTRIVEGLVPWAKAGLMVKDGLDPGSSYAAVMFTGDHGVRMQHDYVHDVAGSATGASWLRLTRSGDTITGYESADGRGWTPIGTAVLAGLPATVQVGLFVTSPGDLTLGSAGAQIRFTQASASFDQVTVSGAAEADWIGSTVGESGTTDWERLHRAAGLVAENGVLTVTGSGDIGPVGTIGGAPLERALLLGLPVLVLVVAVVAARHRGRRVVVGATGFLAGSLAAGLALPAGVVATGIAGGSVLPVDAFTWVGVIVGVALLVGAIAVLAHALRSWLLTAAVTVVPYVLALVLPAEAGDWLLRVTPAAGFAVVQTAEEYPQVLADYSPAVGYFPLPGWAGLAVTCAFAALATVRRPSPGTSGWWRSRYPDRPAAPGRPGSAAGTGHPSAGTG